MSTEIKTKFNETEIIVSQEMIAALRHLMIAEIKMMRQQNQMDYDCWYCGCCKINDLSNSSPFDFIYGSKEDMSWIRKHGEVFVSVPDTGKVRGRKPGYSPKEKKYGQFL